MAKHTLLIRADANMHIGTGHVMRCLALAQAWKDNGGTVTFLMAPGSPSFEHRIQTEGMNFLTIIEQPGSNDDATITAEIAKKIESSWVVVDGYQFGAEYQKILKEHNCRILFIDDYGQADYYYADIVLNQNIYADMLFYKKYEPYTHFLLGTKYVLLRREFLKWSGWHRNIPDVARKILVTLGGSDPDNVTLKVIEAVKTVDMCGLEVIVVIGGTNPHFVLIQETIKNLSNFTLIKNVDNIPELMAWADIAISGGGSTCLELAFMGLPFCIIALAENQRINSERLYEDKVAEYLGWFKEIKPEEITIKINDFLRNQKTRDTMSHLARRLTTGQGAQLIIQQMVA